PGSHRRVCRHLQDRFLSNAHSIDRPHAIAGVTRLSCNASGSTPCECKSKEAGMSFPKKGKSFPDRNGHERDCEGQDVICFTAEIAAALRRSLGPTGAGVKTVAGWTGANEKTVKNWFSGRYGPSGEHLAVLVRHSDEVLNAFLVMAGRQDLMVATKLATAEQAIMELLMAVQSLSDDAEDT